MVLALAGPLVILASSARASTGGALSGRVTFGSAAGSGVPVTAFRVDAGGESEQVGFVEVARAVTDPAGEYAFEDLGAGRYVVRIGSDEVPQGGAGFAREFVPGVASPVDAWVFEVAAGQTVVVDAVEARAGGLVSGRVVDLGGEGVVGVEVRAVVTSDGSDDEPSPGLIGGTALTDESGGFAVPGLPAGEYEVATAGNEEFLSGGFSDTFAVRYGDDVVVGELGLVRAASIRGAVTGAGGAGLAGTDVVAYVETAQGWGEAGSTTTGADGSFELGRLDAGSYRVRVEGGAGYLPRYAGDGPDLEDARVFEVGAGEAAEVGEVPLTRGATLTGHVLADDGSAVAGANVVVFQQRADRGEEPDWAGAATGTTDASGEFVIEGVPSGAALIWADPAERYSARYLGDVKYEEDATRLGLEAGKEIRGLVIVVPEGAQVTGRAQTRHGGPSVGAVVIVSQQLPSGQWSPVDGDRTRDDGGFNIAGLDPGTYKVEVDAIDQGESVSVGFTVDRADGGAPDRRVELGTLTLEEASQ